MSAIGGGGWKLLKATGLRPASCSIEKGADGISKAKAGKMLTTSAFFSDEN